VNIVLAGSFDRARRIHSRVFLFFSIWFPQKARVSEPAGLVEKASGISPKTRGFSANHAEAPQKYGKEWPKSGTPPRKLAGSQHEKMPPRLED
jgi:hypothetical protein